MTSSPMTTESTTEAEAAQMMSTLFPPPNTDRNEVLQVQLAQRAAAEGVLDIAYRTIETPVGELLLAATETGLVRVAFAREDFDNVLAELAASVSPRILRTAIRTDVAARQIDEYFTGRRRSFELPVDLGLLSRFRRNVITYLPEIGYGTTASYAALANAVGNPAAVRAVGSACSHNPLPIVIPCHRVIRSDGAVGQYLGGVDAKVALLTLERGA